MMEVRRRVMLSMASGIKLPDGCEIGTFSPTEDLNTITISHNLGEIPKIALCVAVPNRSFADIPSTSILLEELAVNPETGVFEYDGDSSKKRNAVVSYGSHSYYSPSTWTTYLASITAAEVTFVTGRYYGGKFKAGMNYVYILVK